MKDTKKTSSDELYEKLANPKSFREYLSEKAQNHHNYKCYTCSERFESWCAHKALFLSNGSNWNDISDREAFNPVGDKMLRFGMCFSFSKSESIAMWMLYGGTKKQGIMVDFRQTDIVTKVKQIENITLGYWNRKNFHEVIKLKRPQFEIHLEDVLYYGINDKEPDTYDVKRSDAVCRQISAELVDTVKCIKKKYPWNYENECRLYVSVDKSLIPDEMVDTVYIDVGSTYEKLIDAGRVYNAPNSTGTEAYQPSKMTSLVDWDLCKHCTGKVKN